MSHLRYDIRAKAAPTGTILASFDESEVLVGTKARFQLFGSGSTLIVVQDNQAKVTPTVFAKGNHVTVVDLELGASGEATCGGWLDQGDFDAVSAKEKSGRLLSFGGAGDVAYVRDGVMDSAPYVSSGDGVYNGPRDDLLWHWGVDNTIGSVLKRVFDELLAAGRPRHPVPALTYNFTNDTDSAAAAWDFFTGSFTLAVGRDVLNVIQDFIRLGLTILMKPTLQVNAFQNQYGTDRSNASFAAGKVRFVGGTNIAGTLKKPIHESQALKQILVAGEGAIPSTVVRVTDAAATIEREGFMRYSPLAAGASASLTDAGNRELAARAARVDTAVFPIAHGFDQLAGRYTPGWPGGTGHFWVGDTVRLHTGTGVQDFNEANLRVAAISWVKREGGGQDIVLELGASYAGGSSGGAVSGGGAPVIGCTCPHPPSGSYEFGTPATTDVSWTFPTGIPDGQKHHNEDDSATYSWFSRWNSAGFADIGSTTGSMGGSGPPYPRIPATPATTYAISADLGQNSNRYASVTLDVRWLNSGGSPISGWIVVDTSFAQFGAFEHVAGSIVAPASTAFLELAVNYSTTRIDNILVTHGSADFDQFLGDTVPPTSPDGLGGWGGDLTIYAPLYHWHDAQHAVLTPIDDAGGFFDSVEPNVEAALQVLAARAWKQPVRAATTAAGTLASSFENGDTIDGVVLATGDRILIKNQAAGAENGIYTVNASGAPTRATDFDLGAESVGAAVIVTEGTANADRVFICTTNAPITIGTTALAFAGISPTSFYPSFLGAVNVVIGDGLAVITTGQKAHIRWPFAGVIRRASVLANETGSIVLDIWRDTFANFPPTVADTITASAKPTLASAQKSEDTTLTGWTTAFAEGDIYAINVDSATTVKRITLELKYERT